MKPISTRCDFTIADQFGERLRQARRRGNTSQEELAKVAGLSRGTVYLLERGLRTARLDTIVSLAEALDLTPGELIDGSFPVGMNYREAAGRPMIQGHGCGL